MKTNDKNKIYWHLNFIMAAVVLAVIMIAFAISYSKGNLVEADWFEEFAKYLFMWPSLAVIVDAILYAPFKMLAAKIAKDRGATEE